MNFCEKMLISEISRLSSVYCRHDFSLPCFCSSPTRVKMPNRTWLRTLQLYESDISTAPRCDWCKNIGFCTGVGSILKIFFYSLTIELSVKTTFIWRPLILLTNNLPHQRNANIGTRVLTLKMSGVVQIIQVYSWTKSSNCLKLTTILLLIVSVKMQFSTIPFLHRPYQPSSSLFVIIARVEQLTIFEKLVLVITFKISIISMEENIALSLSCESSQYLS